MLWWSERFVKMQCWFEWSFLKLKIHCCVCCLVLLIFWLVCSRLFLRWGLLVILRVCCDIKCSLDIVDIVLGFYCWCFSSGLLGRFWVIVIVQCNLLDKWLHDNRHRRRWNRLRENNRSVELGIVFSDAGLRCRRLDRSSWWIRFAWSIHHLSIRLCWLCWWGLGWRRLGLRRLNVISTGVLGLPPMLLRNVLITPHKHFQMPDTASRVV